MPTIGLIKTLLQALCAYLQLRNKSFYHNLHRESQQKQESIINEIESLRSKRSASATERADLLRDKLIAEKRYLKHISAFYDSIDPRDNDTDKGGDI